MDSPSSALIFLGTGCSSGVPSPKCLISDLKCQVCSLSLSLSPESNPNYRCNTSLLIDYYSETSAVRKYILIDVGKTFREQLLRWFMYYKIPRVDSVILTHEHADAVLGLGDLGAVQPLCGQTGHVLRTPVHLNQDTMSSIAQKLSYLMQNPPEVGQEEERELPEFEWRIIESNCQTSFVASGLRFVPLPVKHGEDYVSLGFLFGEKCKVAYISDVSRFPPDTEYAISCDGAGQVDLLILDSNTTREITSPSAHLCLSRSLEAVIRIAPKRALLVGMNHDFDHETSNVYLQEWSRREGIPVQLGRDGLKIAIEL